MEIELGKVLNAKEIKACIHFLDHNQLPELKGYLNKRKEKLIKKGMVADFLYYVLQSLRHQGKI